MNKKSIITVAGNVGSGKSSAANGVAEVLGYKRYSSGDFMRSIAERHGVSIEEINKIAHTDTSIDEEIDEKNKKVGKSSEIVIDARLAYHFIPKSFKVFLTIDPRISAERIFKQMKDEGRHRQSASSIEEIVKNTKDRYTSEKKRYMDLYELDVTDLSPFNLTIDTSKTPLSEVVKTITRKYKDWLAD